MTGQPRPGIDYATKRRWQNRVRWTMAHHLDRLPWTCWAALVSWALHYRPLLSSDGGDVRQDYACRSATAWGRCYCGKVPVPTLPPEPGGAT